jgi:hypothetical protein
MLLEIEMDDRVSEALKRSDGVMRRHLGNALLRGAREMADAARRRAPTS